jgi:hypothetical protein
MSTLKTYVLLEHTESTAPIYQRINKDQRVRLQKRPNDAAYLQLTFYDNKEQKNRTARLKLSSNTIWQDEQIKEGVLANAPFTTAERNAVKFKNGVLMTKNERVQFYLENIPQCEGVDAECDAIKEPLYRIYDKSVKLKADNDEFLKRLEAGLKIKQLKESGDVTAGQNLMIKLNGTFFKAPDDMEEIIDGLISFLDDADEAGLDKLLSDTTTKDEEISILVGRAIAAKEVSFDQKQNQVSLKKGTGWVDVKMISSELPASERQRYFSEFLSSVDGENLYKDLKKRVEKKQEKVTA